VQYIHFCQQLAEHVGLISSNRSSSIALMTAQWMSITLTSRPMHCLQLSSQLRLNQPATGSQITGCHSHCTRFNGNTALLLDMNVSIIQCSSSD